MLFRLPVALTALLPLAAVVVAIPAGYEEPSSVVVPEPSGRTCGSHRDSEVMDKKEKAFAALVAENKSNGEEDAKSSFQIMVHFHIIVANNTAEGGDIDDKQMWDQINVLNQDYGGTGLTFALERVTRTENPVWFHKASRTTPEQTEMKNALRGGTASTLNIYTVGFTGSKLLGYATFPDDFESNSQDDGIVLLYSSLPGGSMEPFNLGRTATHEVGHWVGLYHTFTDGCEGRGDFVSDTPAEESPASGCPTGRDSCPGRQGLDPIQNYMDYSDDACMDNFSPGQIRRLKSQVSTYRGINL